MREIDTRDMDILDAVEVRMNEEKVACDDYISSVTQFGTDIDVKCSISAAFYSGIEWQRNSQWYPCDGDILPPYDMSVIVRLVDKDGEYFGETFMHRSKNPNVYKDCNDWALIAKEMKHTHWCYVPEFYN